jgi:hypothetical protein
MKEGLSKKAVSTITPNLASKTVYCIFPRQSGIAPLGMPSISVIIFDFSFVFQNRTLIFAVLI